MTPRDWLLILTVLAMAAVAFVAALPWIVQPMLRAVLFLRYRTKVRGLEHLPMTGPALVVANHVTWLDGFFVAAAFPRRGRALANAAVVNLPVVRLLARRAGLIPAPASGPHALKAVIRASQEVLDRGEALLIFPEAQLSRNGLTGPFLRGVEVILHGRESIPVIPIFLDNLWGSVFSLSGGTTFRKRPRGLRRTVIVSFGRPVPPPVTAFRARQGVIEAGVRAFELRRRPARPLETLDLALPHLEHPTLGLLTASTPDFDWGGIRQVGQKPGTLGQAVPGVALRIVDDAGAPLPPESEGRLQALRAGQPDWADTGLRASLDRDGFVRLR